MIKGACNSWITTLESRLATSEQTLAAVRAEEQTKKESTATVVASGIVYEDNGKSWNAQKHGPVTFLKTANTDGSFTILFDPNLNFDPIVAVGAMNLGTLANAAACATVTPTRQKFEVMCYKNQVPLDIGFWFVVLRQEP